MQSLHSSGVGAAQPEQLLMSESGPRMESGQQPQGVWSGQMQQGFDHPALQQHQLQQLHQHQQQQLQQQLMLGGPGSLAPLVGQQISQLLGPGQQHQSPPGLSGPTLNMMLGGPHLSMAGPMFPGQPVQSPPSSSGQFLLLPGQQPRQEPALSPNSTPGLQTPTPAATPPIGLERTDLLGPRYEGEHGERDQALALRGLQALQGGTLAEMLPSMERGVGQFNGLERQIPPSGHPTQIERSLGGPTGFPTMPGTSGQGFNNNYTIAMAAAQAQENMMRLQQLQQTQEFHPKHGLPPLHQFQQYQPQPILPQPDLSRQYPGFPPPQCQSPSPNGFSLPPGPRPRPVGGDSSPPGYTPDSVPPPISNEEPSQLLMKDTQPPLVIGSWNEECDKESLPTSAVTAPNLSQPPPRHGQSENNEWGGTFHVPRSGGQSWGEPDKAGGRSSNTGTGHDGENKGRRGGRGGRGGAHRGRGGGPRASDAELNQEKAKGKNAAIEETKAMMAKMRLEEKEMMSKYKKEKGLPEDEIPEENKVQPGAYRPRERRGRDDRKDGQRGRGNRGRGRGGPPPVPGQAGPMPHVFGMPPYIPGDFRTPPFPGMEGFLPPPGIGQFPPGFPPHFAPGFPPGMFPPGGFPGDMRGRGGFNRGRGFPVGFPPRGFPPPMINNRGRGGRGGYQPGVRERDGRGDDKMNPMMTAIEGNKEEVESACEVETTEPEEETATATVVASTAPSADVNVGE